MIYVLAKIKEWNGGYTDPEVMGATTSKELADRWGNTSSYIHGEIHEVIECTEKYAKRLVIIAEETEKEREKNYGEGNNTGTEGAVL